MIIRLVIPVFVAAIALTASASAQSKQDLDLCWSENPQTGIPACTRLIQSGLYTGTDLSKIYGTRAHLLRIKGDLEGALRDCNESVRIDPTNNDGWYNRGVIRMTLGQRDLAISDFRRALQLDPKDASAIKNLKALGVEP